MRIAILAYNGSNTMRWLMACARLGAILVPLNWRLAPPELVYIVEDSGGAVRGVRSERFR